MTRAVVPTMLLVLVPLHISAQNAASPVEPTRAPENSVRASYVLGPGDQIAIRAFEVDEISDKPYRIDSEGDLNLPILGKVHAGGLTVEQFESDLSQRLKTLVRNPQVSVSVVTYRAEPVFVTGYFKTTGIIPLQGGRTLLEVLTSVGGLQPNASRRIQVTRHLEEGRIPLPNATVDEERKVSTVEINIADLKNSLNPAENIQLQPLDTINVDRAEMVYVNGEVTRPGGFELGERESIPVTQLIAMVGGLGKDADPANLRVLRPVLRTSRRAEIQIDFKKILAGQQADFPLLPNDVLYIPKSHKFKFGSVGLIAVPAATGLVYVLASKL